jgi:hypothetical protein
MKLNMRIDLNLILLAATNVAFAFKFEKTNSGLCRGQKDLFYAFCRM